MKALNHEYYFDALLTVHLSIFISVVNQLDAQNSCFTISLFHASTCFEHMCSSSGGQNCIRHPLVSSHLQVAVWCTGCASSWLIGEINILRCTVSRTSQFEIQMILVKIFISPFVTAREVLQKRTDNPPTIFASPSAMRNVICVLMSGLALTGPCAVETDWI